MTQNPNESVNNTICHMVSVIPRSTFVELKIRKLGVNMAIAQFNMRHVAKLTILKHSDTEPSYNCVPCFKNLDARRIYVAQRKHLEISKKDQEITSNKHIKCQVIKARKRLNVLKFISGRDWGVEASTLRTTFISLIRPVLEFGIPIYFCASDTNLNKLERVQLCAARIITGLRYSCQIDIVLFESNLPSLSKSRLYSLTRYFNKLYSYNEQHRTSAYLQARINNRRWMKQSHFSYARTLNLPSSDVEPYSLSFTGAGLELDGIYFHDQLLTSVTKSSEIPALVNQLALETINGIPQSSLKIYTDGNRGKKGISGSGVYIPTPSGTLEFKIKTPNYCSAFRSELIAIRRGLQCAAQLEDRFQEIWILTNSRASIQHLTNWGDIGDQTSMDILSLLHDLSSGHSIHFQWIPSPIGIEGNERADFLARTTAVKDISYPTIIRSAILPVPHGPDLPIPSPPDTLDNILDDLDQISHISSDDGYDPGTNDPELFSQSDLNDLVRDLGLPKDTAEVLGSRLKERHLLNSGSSFLWYRFREKEFVPFFMQKGNLVFCNNVPEILEMFKIMYKPEEWRLQKDSLKRSLKAVLLHNGNRYAFVPVGHSVHLKEFYENLEFILNMLSYSDHKWTICGD
ncbi:putative RNA-directed DNA polymerase from transposon BS [Trichonephila clavipes]|nr:putative RNA-directed DNA polymerase from transposon BS [Trichonephila clavipes]